MDNKILKLVDSKKEAEEEVNLIEEADAVLEDCKGMFEGFIVIGRTPEGTLGTATAGLDRASDIIHLLELYKFLLMDEMYG